jgi:hypothetical protein
MAALRRRGGEAYNVVIARERSDEAIQTEPC